MTAAERIEWSAADRETLLKAKFLLRFSKSSGQKIRAFLNDVEFLLTLCNRPRERCGYFVLSWLGSEEADKVRRAHFADSLWDYDRFRKNLIGLFDKYEFKVAFRVQCRNLKQSAAESIAAFAARTIHLCSRAYPDFSTESMMSIAIEQFISGIADASSREYMICERARRRLDWAETVRLAQASEAARLTNPFAHAAAAAENAFTSANRTLAESRAHSSADHASRPASRTRRTVPGISADRLRVKRVRVTTIAVFEGRLRPRVRVTRRQK